MHGLHEMRKKKQHAQNDKISLVECSAIGVIDFYLIRLLRPSPQTNARVLSHRQSPDFTCECSTCPDHEHILGIS